MRICPECNNPMKQHDKCETCGWSRTVERSNGNPYRHGIKIGDRWIDKQCAWNDHGQQCPDYGSMSQGTSGEGPWYCSRHYAALMGWDWSPAKPNPNTPVVEEVLKRLKPQDKSKNHELMARLQSIREPLEQEEPGANG